MYVTSSQTELLARRTDALALTVVLLADRRAGQLSKHECVTGSKFSVNRGLALKFTRQLRLAPNSLFLNLGHFAPLHFA